MSKHDHTRESPQYRPEPEEAPRLMSPGSTAFHLPRSLLNPDQDKKYGFKAYRCGGVDDVDSINRATERGWYPLKASEIPELQVAPNMNIFADRQDDLVRVQGTVLMAQNHEAQSHWELQDETLLTNYKNTVALYRKVNKEDFTGPEAHRGYGNW